VAIPSCIIIIGQGRTAGADLGMKVSCDAIESSVDALSQLKELYIWGQEKYNNKISWHSHWLSRD